MPLSRSSASIADPGNSLPGIYGRTPLNLRRWRRAIARVRAGSGIGRLAYIGDSTVRGWGAATGTNGLTGANVLSAPFQLARILNGAGVPAQADSFFGNGAMSTATVPLFDPRITLGAGWTTGATIGPGGSVFQINTAASTGTLTFHPADAYDTADVYYIAAAGGGTFTTNVDNGASLGTVNTNLGTGVVTRLTVAGLGGGSSHYFNIVPTAGSGTLYVVGVDTYLSTAPRISVWNMGWIGAKSSDWSQTGQNWFPVVAVPAMAPDLALIDLGINDWLNGIPVATTQANLQAVVSALKAGGTTDVALVCPIQSDPASTGIPQAVQDGFRTMIRALAASNGLLAIDLPGRFGAQGIPYGDGLTYDNVHFNAIGYADKALALAEALGSP